MRLSVVKDKVLYSLVNEHPIFKSISDKIDRNKVNEALVELRDENYITLIETSVSGSGKVRTYSFQSLLPKAVNFVNDKESFRGIEIKKNLKKSFNYLITTLTQLGLLAIALYTTYQSVSEIQTYRKEMQQIRLQLDTLQKEHNTTPPLIIQKSVNDSSKK